jgi:hypothetical protein
MKTKPASRIVFALMLWASLATRAHCMIVPGTEVPGNCAVPWASDCKFTQVWERDDDPAVLSGEGTSKELFWEEYNCDQCNNNIGANCNPVYTVTYKDTVSYSVEASISGKVVIEASLKGTLGAQTETARTFTLPCGIAPHPGCARTVYTSYQNIREGRTASITGRYKCTFTATTGPKPPCMARGTVESTPAGTKTFAATGDIGSATGGCRGTSVDCPLPAPCVCAKKAYP